MNPPFFVEILSRTEGVKYRHQANSLPIRIGRGYDNDVILDDPQISAHHAIIEQTADGGLIIKDLGSRNAIRHKGSRCTELVIDGNTIFRLGQTNLRVRFSDFPVDTEEVTDTVWHNWEGWRTALAGLAMIVMVFFFETWIDDWKKFSVIRYLSTNIPMVIAGFIWCGIWSFANRLFGGKARFGRHMFFLGCGIAAIEIWTILSAAVAYAFSWEILSRYSSHVCIAMLAAMVFFHLLTINPRRGRFFTLMVVLLAILGSGLMLMLNFSKKGILSDELYMSERFPPILRLSADKPVSLLISNATKLKANIDEERVKPGSYDAEDRDED
jgi:pSer/pThr/pTyr-binding forkhead associated (FHA) protein